MLDVSSHSYTHMDEISATYLLAVCRDGKLFYSHAAESVENYSIKRALQQMAITRQELLKEVSAKLAIDMPDNQHDPHLDGIKLWYTDAIDQAWDFSDMMVLSKLRALESKNLDSLIQAIKKTSNQYSRELMSNVAARFQLCLDLLDSIIAKQS
ncbi:hypothetical protein [Neptunicella sp.]|uniref:hypothetical protein n=1 Tax=Neptunicella sp. TaxID=2125986 RepID=UPI003F68D62C